MRRTQGLEYRTAVVRVRLSGCDQRKAFQVTHRCGLLYTELAGHAQWFHDTYGRDPTQAESLGSVHDLEVLRMHAHSKIGVYTRLMDNITTTRSNRRTGMTGVRLPYRAKNYMPVTFTRNYGWRVTATGRLALSLGRADGRILLPLPDVVDPRTSEQVSWQVWGEMELCWDRDNRVWTLHITYPVTAPPALNPDKVISVDEGIINHMTACVETPQAYEVTVVNGRAARSVKHRRNTAVGSLRQAQSRCVEGSRRWRELNQATKRANGKAARSLRNIDHQVSRKITDMAVRYDTGTIVAGDVRGIEQNTRQAEKQRVGRHQRRRLSQWSRGRQERYLTEKTGVAIQYQDESWSSKTCPACSTRNRPTGRAYKCSCCGFTCHRDAVGALNILQRFRHGAYTPIDVNKPIHVTYLRATPLVPPGTGRVTLSTGPMRPTTSLVLVA